MIHILWPIIYGSFEVISGTIEIKTPASLGPLGPKWDHYFRKLIFLWSGAGPGTAFAGPIDCRDAAFKLKLMMVPLNEQHNVSNFRPEHDIRTIIRNGCSTGPSGGNSFSIWNDCKIVSRFSTNFLEILIQVRSLLKPGIFHKLPYGTFYENVTLLL